MLMMMIVQIKSELYQIIIMIFIISRAHPEITGEGLCGWVGEYAVGNIVYSFWWCCTLGGAVIQCSHFADISEIPNLI